MAGKQYQHTDKNEDWQPSSGLVWPHWLTLSKARTKHQEATKGQEGRAVREVSAPTPGTVSEHVTSPVWTSMGSVKDEPRRRRR